LVRSVEHSRTFLSSGAAPGGASGSPIMLAMTVDATEGTFEPNDIDGAFAGSPETFFDALKRFFSTPCGGLVSKIRGYYM